MTYSAEVFPLYSLKVSSAIALENIDNTERVRDCLGKITLSSRHLLGLINDVLDMSKIELHGIHDSLGNCHSEPCSLDLIDL